MSGKKGLSGRKPGIPNKVTADVRVAIAAFAERNAPNLSRWLDRVAKTDPARAAEIYLRAIEYHVPKLARTEITGKDGGPVEQSLEVIGVPSPRAKHK
jgi:hypothetical protein